MPCALLSVPPPAARVSAPANSHVKRASLADICRLGTGRVFLPPFASPDFRARVWSVSKLHTARFSYSLSRFTSRIVATGTHGANQIPVSVVDTFVEKFRTVSACDSCLTCLIHDAVVPSPGTECRKGHSASDGIFRGCLALLLGSLTISPEAGHVLERKG